MARIFITGSSDGIGSLTAKRLIAAGHSVVIHARNPQRAADAAKLCPGAAAVLVADLTSLDETRRLAADANALGPPFDAVVHNAGLYLGHERVLGKSGLPSLFAVNTLAPYTLTCLLDRPKRLVFVTSGMHRSGRARLDDLLPSTYSDSKLHNVLLAKAFARRWKDVPSNAVDPGWVPTKMGGASAPDNIEDSVEGFMNLALDEGPASGKSGAYFHAIKEGRGSKVADDVATQDQLLKELEKISGVAVPD